MNFSDGYASFKNHNDMLIKPTEVTGGNYGKKFNQDSRTVTKKNIHLTGMGINRWTPLFFDPQKNCIENFTRGGENSVLNTLDTYKARGDKL
jgi:hypothetical protein